MAENYAAAKTKGGTTADVSELNRPSGEPTGEDFHGLPVLGDDDHPLIPDVGHGYIKRELKGNKTDVEVVSRFVADDQYATLLTGETGTGKDQLVEYLCAATNRPCVRVNFGSGTTYSDLIGDYAPAEDGEQERIQQVKSLSEQEDISMAEAANVLGAESNFEFKPGILYQAVKYGWTFVADEINAAGPEATMPLHGLTEDNGQLVVQPTSEVLSPHENFQFVATMNPPKYAGTKPMNDAFRSRFWEVEIDYLPSRAEQALLFEATGLENGNDEHERVAERLTDLAENLRQSHAEQDLMTPTSHRSIIKIGRLISEMGFEPEAAAKQILETRAAAEDKSAVAKAIETTNWP